MVSYRLKMSGMTFLAKESHGVVNFSNYPPFSYDTLGRCRLRKTQGI